jgi:hypothetical protein
MYKNKTCFNAFLTEKFTFLTLNFSTKVDTIQKSTLKNDYF